MNVAAPCTDEREVRPLRRAADNDRDLAAGWNVEASIDTAGPPEQALTSVSIAAAVDRAAATAADAGLRWRAAACAAAELAACTCASVSTLRPIHRMRIAKRNCHRGDQHQPERVGLATVATDRHSGTQPSSETAAATRTGADVPRSTPGAPPVIVTITTVAVRVDRHVETGQHAVVRE